MLTQVFYFLSNIGQNRLIVGCVHNADHPPADVAHLIRTHAAGSQSRGADANTAWVQWLTRALVVREQVPEIKRFLFRYYDGANWQTAWDSRRDGSLPLAVECLLVWRDSSKISAVAPNVETLGPTETLEPTGMRKELDEISLSSVWENLGRQDYSATSARLPKGFGRYVFCLPAGLPSQRHLADSPAVSLGRR